MDSEWLPLGRVSLENKLCGDFDQGEQQQSSKILGQALSQSDHDYPCLVKKGM